MEIKSCLECEHILIDITNKHYCGHPVIRNNDRTKWKQLDNFIKEGLIPNSCPLKK